MKKLFPSPTLIESTPKYLIQHENIEWECFLVGRQSYCFSEEEGCNKSTYKCATLSSRHEDFVFNRLEFRICEGLHFNEHEAMILTEEKYEECSTGECFIKDCYTDVCISDYCLTI